MADLGVGQHFVQQVPDPGLDPGHLRRVEVGEIVGEFHLDIALGR